MDAVLADVETAPLSDKDRALYRLIAKTNADSRSIQQEDLDAARAAGWNDEALYDAISVHALFKFYNAWIDATGVADMPASAYEMSGKRLATAGYYTAPSSAPGSPTTAPDGAGHAPPTEVRR